MMRRTLRARGSFTLLALALFAPIASAEAPPAAETPPAAESAPSGEAPHIAAPPPVAALPRNVLSPLLVLPVKPPIPVPLSDGRIHLAYELLLVNESESRCSRLRGRAASFAKDTSRKR